MNRNIITIVFVVLALAGCRDDADGDSIEKKVEVNSEKSIDSVDDFIYSEVFPDYRGEGYITYFDLSEEDCKSGQHKFVTLYVDGSVHHDKVISKKISPYYEYKNEEANIDVVESACQVKLSKASGVPSQPLIVFMDVDSLGGGTASSWIEMTEVGDATAVITSQKYLKGTSSSGNYNCGNHFKVLDGVVVGGSYGTKLKEYCRIFTFEKITAVICGESGEYFVYKDDYHVSCGDSFSSIDMALKNALWGSVEINGVRLYVLHFYTAGETGKGGTGGGYIFVPQKGSVRYTGRRALGNFYKILPRE